MPLQPTSSQEKFFAVAEKHGGEASEREMGMHQKLSLFFVALRQGEARREFYSLFDGRNEEDAPPEGNPIITEDAGMFGFWGMVMRFSRATERYGFDDFKVVRGIQELIQRMDTPMVADRISATQALINQEMGDKRQVGKGESKTYVMENKSEEIIQHAVELLKELRERLPQVSPLLEEHGIMEAAQHVLTQIEVCINILGNIQVQKTGNAYVCTVPPEIAIPFTDEERTVPVEESSVHDRIRATANKDYESVNVDAAFNDTALCEGYARAVYLEHLGIDKYLEAHETLSSI